MKHLFDVNPNYLVSLDCTFMVGTTYFSFQCFSTPFFFPYVVVKVLYPTSDCTYNLCFTEPSDYCCPAPSIGHWPRPLRIQLKNISFGPGTLKFVTQPVLFVCPPPRLLSCSLLHFKILISCLCPATLGYLHASIHSQHLALQQEVDVQ